MITSRRVVSNDHGITITACEVDDATKQALTTNGARLPETSWIWKRDFDLDPSRYMKLSSTRHVIFVVNDDGKLYASFGGSLAIKPSMDE